MERRGKGSQPALLLAVGFLFFLVAVFFGVAEAWVRYGCCLLFSTVFVICGLQESQYRRFLRRLDELKELISEKQTKEENERATEKPGDRASKSSFS